MKNKLYKLIIFSLIFGAANFKAFSQLKCGNPAVTKKLYQEHPEIAAAEQAAETNLQELLRNRTPEQRSGTQVYIIPIVFHIIHQNGIENIPDANVFDEVNILNEDYRKLNSDTSVVYPGFKSRVADSRIEFRLAQKDPNGNCTNGIDRIYSHKTFSADDESKLNQWPRDKYLNVWVVNSIGTAGVAGYAYQPASASGFLTPYDGILILYNYIGSLSPGSAFTSRALTHEIGHYLNLAHPWGNTNDPEVACGDDGVSDTPVTMGHSACNAIDKFTHDCTFKPLNKAVYQFNDVTTTSGNIDPTVNDTTENVTLGGVVATGVSANSATNGKFEFSGWGTGATNGATYNSATTFGTLTGAVNTGKYYQFTITPRTPDDSSICIKAISFTVNRSATGPRTWVVRSGPGFATNIAPVISPANTNLYIGGSTVAVMKYDSTSSQIGITYNLTAASFTSVTPITFRIYAYNAEDALGTFGIDSLRITGTHGLIENYQNFMDYSYCSVMYTNGQKDRMRAALESQISQRSNLWTDANLAFTGVDQPTVCLAHPEFFSNKVRICAGTGTINTVKFTKNVQYGTPDSIRWYFEGGTPSTSNFLSPVIVTYPNAGQFKVTLIAYNAAGIDSVVKDNFIRVDESWATPFTGFYTESWEDPTKFFWDWTVINYDNNSQAWQFSNTAGYQGTKCVYMSGFNDYKYDIDDLLSPAFDFTFNVKDSLTFKCAAASRAGSLSEIDDALKVYTSSNCGNTWSLRATFKDSSLINNGYQPASWSPNATSTWTTRTVKLTPADNVNNLRFKFEYNSGSSNNNVYIDDINILGVVGINESATEAMKLSIYPNPANQTSTLAYHLENKADTKIEVIDVLGKSVFSQTNNGQPEGDYSVVISKQELHLVNGIYFVKFSVDNEVSIKKLIISE
jgi:hypothetical protein